MLSMKREIAIGYREPDVEHAVEVLTNHEGLLSM